MLELRIRPRAKTDIKKIWRYSYKHWGIQQADNYTAVLKQAIATMPENPEIGISIDSVRKNYRQYHIKRHLTIYRLTTTNRISNMPSWEIHHCQFQPNQSIQILPSIDRPTFLVYHLFLITPEQ